MTCSHLYDPPRVNERSVVLKLPEGLMRVILCTLRSGGDPRASLCL